MSTENGQSMNEVRLSQKLAGAAAKIDRADAKIQELAEMTAGLQGAVESCCKLTRGFEPDGVTFSFKVSGEVVVPPIVSAVVGEVVHQLRSIFDHVIWALVEANARTPDRRNMFPVAKTEQEFNYAVHRGAINGLSDAACAFVKKWQPIEAEDPALHILALLHDMDINDKHRLLLVVGAAARMGEQVTVTASGGPVVIAGLAPPILPVPLTLEPQAYFSITLQSPTPGFDAELGILLSLQLWEGALATQSREMIEVLNLFRDFTVRMMGEASDLLDA